MSTPTSRKTGLNYRGRWGRRVFDRMYSVIIVGYVRVDVAYSETTYVYPNLPQNRTKV